MTLQYRSILDEPKGPSAGQIVFGIISSILCLCVFAATVSLIAMTVAMLMGKMPPASRAAAVGPAFAASLCGFATATMFRLSYRLLTAARPKGPAAVFTRRFTMSMKQAMREAWSRGAREVEPIHLLLGVLGSAPNTAVLAMARLKVSPDGVRARVDAVGPVQRPAGEGEVPALEVTPQARRIISLAIQLATCSELDHIGTEHLLMALLREAGGAAGEAMAGVGLDDRGVEAKVEEIRASSPGGFLAEVLEKSLDESSEVE